MLTDRDKVLKFKDNLAEEITLVANKIKYLKKNRGKIAKSVDVKVFDDRLQELITLNEVHKLQMIELEFELDEEVNRVP